MTGLCSLCGHDRDLQESHIIPKFIGKWLKQTSGTGFLVNANHASKRVQDLITLRLLCHDCEERFSKFETYFANEIFFPFHKKQAKSFEYDGRLELFAISLSWRALKTQYDTFKLEHPHFSSLVDQAEIHWREFLMGSKQTICPYENHLLFLDYLKSGDGILPQFNWYTLRAVDATIVANEKRILIYVKLPWMIFVSSIYPTTLEGWEGTDIKESGTLTTHQSNKDGEFERFLLDRAAIALTHSSGPSPEISKSRLLKAIKRDAQKFLESDTLQTMIKEKDLLREQKMKDMPASVIALVEKVIIPQVDDLSATKAENQMKRWESRKIADALARLSKKEATTLDNIIQSTIDRSRVLQHDTKSNLKTNSVWITFMVNRRSTKEYQHSIIRKEIEMLEKKQSDVKIPLAVFSMNLDDDSASFESGFLIYCS